MSYELTFTCDHRFTDAQGRPLGYCSAGKRIERPEPSGYALLVPEGWILIKRDAGAHPDNPYEAYCPEHKDQH